MIQLIIGPWSYLLRFILLLFTGISILFSNFILAISLLGTFLTYQIVIASIKTGWHNVTLEIEKDYREKDMRDSVKNLWNFRRMYDTDNDQEHESMKSAFRFMLEEDIDYIDSDRRKVIFFYDYIGILLDYKILEEKIIYDMLPRDTLRIIPEILIPLGAELQDYISELEGQEPKELHGKERLMRIYSNSP